MARIRRIIDKIIHIVIICYILYVIQKFWVITKIDDTVSKYENRENQFITTTIDNSDGSQTTKYYYKKGNKKAFFINTTPNGKVQSTLMYDDGVNHHAYSIYDESEFNRLDGGLIDDFKYFNPAKDASVLEKIIISLTTRVDFVYKNGVPCLRFRDYALPFSKNKDKPVYLVDFQSYMLYMYMDNDEVGKLHYDYTYIDELVFKEPDAILFEK